MSDKVEIWITTDCTEVIKRALLNRGIAMGNEFRFDKIGWTIIVTRTADLFLEVLRQALEHRLTAEYPDLELGWRMALGKDALLLAPSGQDREKEITRIREIMGFVRELLYDRRFVAVTLRAVLTEAFSARWEEKLLANTLDREAVIAKLVGDLNAVDVAEAAAAIEAGIPRSAPEVAGIAPSPEAPTEAPGEEEPPQAEPAPAEEPEEIAEPAEPEQAASDEPEAPAEADDEDEPPSAEKKGRKRRKKE